MEHPFADTEESIAALRRLVTSLTERLVESERLAESVRDEVSHTEARYNAALAVSEGRHRVLIQTMLHGVVHQAAGGTIIQANSAAEFIFGQSETQLVGGVLEREAHQTIREDGSPFPPAEHPAMVAMRTGATVRGVIMGICNPTGGERRWISIDSVPIHSVSGQPPFETYTVFDDITSRRQTDRVLRESEARLMLGVRVAGLALAEIDYGANLVELTDAASRAYGLGHSSQVVSRETLHGTFHPDDKAQMELQIAQCLDPRGTGCFAMDHRVLWPSGEVRWLRVSKQVFFEGQADSRHPHRAMLAALDVTEERAATQALRDADEEKNVFIATLAHELRNPLAPIRNVVNILRHDEAGASNLVWCRDVIDRQVEHMARLLEDLLDISRISSGKITLRRANHRLRLIVQRAAEISQPLFDSAGHTLKTLLPQSDVVINGDLTRLAQIFSNILSNAAKYTEQAGDIILEAKADREHVFVSIKDGGIGIATEDIARVFEMFNQVEAGKVRSQGGLGIGLSLVRGLVELHGGKVMAKSDGVGRGSEFTVMLPLAPTESALSTVAEGGAHHSFRRHRILVVDDTRDSADSLRALLTALGHEARVAYDGNEAIKLANAYRPSVILLDLGMPTPNGYETCRQLRAEPWAAKTMFVAQTGWSQRGDRLRATAAGFDHHLVKPIDASELTSLLNRHSTSANQDG